MATVGGSGNKQALMDLRLAAIELVVDDTRELPRIHLLYACVLGGRAVIRTTLEITTDTALVRLSLRLAWRGRGLSGLRHGIARQGRLLWLLLHMI